MTSQLAQFQSKLELPTFIPTIPHFFASFPTSFSFTPFLTSFSFAPFLTSFSFAPFLTSFSFAPFLTSFSFIPSYPCSLFSSFIPRSDPNDEVSRVAVLQWISLSDFYIWPHISQFNSWEELFTLLVRTYVRENVHISFFFGSFIY